MEKNMEPDNKKFKDKNGKEHDIPPGGVEANDDDAYREWVEEQQRIKESE